MNTSVSSLCPSLHQIGVLESMSRVPLYRGDCATSSLDIAHELISQGLLPEWGSVLLDAQTAGRGQMRRVWHSKNGNIFGALRLPMVPPLDGLAAAPAVGVLIMAALNNLGFAVQLRWPNDLVAWSETGQRFEKVGGILLEERAKALVAGIGINVAAAPECAEMREGYSFAAGILPVRQVKKRCGPDESGAQKNTPIFGLQSAPELWVELVEQMLFCYHQNEGSVATSWWLTLAGTYLSSEFHEQFFSSLKELGNG